MNVLLSLYRSGVVESTGSRIKFFKVRQAAKLRARNPSGVDPTPAQALVIPD